MDYRIIKLRDHPERKRALARWFHEKWGVPLKAYLESMDACLAGEGPVPQWYAALEGRRIIGGLGVIENDFHDRPDLAPNVCAVYVEEDCRCRGIAGALLSIAREDMAALGVDTLYLLTDHTSFYERYGWEFYCMARGDGEDKPSRMYVRRSGPNQERKKPVQIKDTYRNYVFDLYGTLVDIHTDEEDPRLWEQFARYLGFLGLRVEGSGLREEYLWLCERERAQLSAELARKNLPGPAEIDLLRIWTALGEAHGVSLTQVQTGEISRVFRAFSTHRLRLYDGAAELLETLRAQGKKIYLLTNAQGSFTRPELTLLGIENAFDGVFISSEAGVGKPSRSFFDLLWQAGLEPGESVMVGNDDMCDCRGAASVGMESFYIRTEQSPRPTLPLPAGCQELTSLRDLLPKKKTAGKPPRGK